MSNGHSTARSFSFPFNIIYIVLFKSFIDRLLARHLPNDTWESTRPCILGGIAGLTKARHADGTFAGGELPMRARSLQVGVPVWSMPHGRVASPLDSGEGGIMPSWTGEAGAPGYGGSLLLSLQATFVTY